MPAVQECQLPGDALLDRYRRSGDYTDCFCTVIDRPVGLAEFITAFYTTTLFKSERLVLKWFASRPSTDDDVAELACATSNEFAAWSVESRAADQLLLRDFRGNTRSWLMVRAGVDGARVATLYFGSAVTASTQRQDGSRQLEKRFRALMWLHRRYSVALLSAARKSLLRARAS